jgi:hypothetical protein
MKKKEAEKMGKAVPFGQINACGVMHIFIVSGCRRAVMRKYQKIPGLKTSD